VEKIDTEGLVGLGNRIAEIDAEDVVSVIENFGEIFKQSDCKDFKQIQRIFEKQMTEKTNEVIQIVNETGLINELALDGEVISLFVILMAMMNEVKDG